MIKYAGRENAPTFEEQTAKTFLFYMHINHILNVADWSE
jgi:hypothetical protein